MEKEGGAGGGGGAIEEEGDAGGGAMVEEEYEEEKEEVLDYTTTLEYNLMDAIRCYDLAIGTQALVFPAKKKIRVKKLHTVILYNQLPVCRTTE